MGFLSKLFGGKSDKETFRLSQGQLVEFMARMKAAGVSLEDDANTAAAMFAITGLGYSNANNRHALDGRQYEVGMEGGQIVVKFPRGILRK